MSQCGEASLMSLPHAIKQMIQRPTLLEVKIKYGAKTSEFMYFAFSAPFLRLKYGIETRP
jgi:hypothetical protein